MDATLPVGTTLQGRYRIEGAIASGRNAATYKATDTSNGMVVAVKEMLEVFPDPVQREKALAQFSGEFKTLSALNHPGLPKVYAHFEESDRHFLVMDLVEARSLEQVVQEMPSPPNETQAMNWLWQLCEVLEYLHSQTPPVIYRDLRPANIMLTNEGNIKLLDFGIAKMQDPGKPGRTLFRAVGSPEYAPPEQFGMARSDPRTDIYALGASFYYVLTRAVPPQASDRVIRNAPLLDVRQVNPGVGQAFVDAVLKMMSIKPADRPPNMQEVKSMLTPIKANIGNAPAQPPPAPAPAAASQPPAAAAPEKPAPEKAAPAPAAAAPAPAASAPKPTPIPVAKAPRAAEPEPPIPPGPNPIMVVVLILLAFLVIAFVVRTYNATGHHRGAPAVSGSPEVPGTDDTNVAPTDTGSPTDNASSSSDATSTEAPPASATTSP
ncbi:MAG: serine/threonine protein kinase [Candidatus Xenobia bacterium]